jgi:atypical dual specificity phosphatase
LEEKNISAIVTVMQEPHPFSLNEKFSNFKFHHIPIHDKIDVNIIEYIPEFVKFMEECCAENRIMYIHCQMGISRSVSFVIAYIMQKENKKLNDAFKFVKDRRPQADPNFGFMCQLMTYEKTLDL